MISFAATDMVIQTHRFSAERPANGIRSARLLALVATLAAVTAIYCPPHGRSEPSSDAPPFPIGQLGIPVHVQAGSGATADITLKSVVWHPPVCALYSGCNVVELTITATSPKQFEYKGGYVTAGYGGGDQPWTHPTQTQRQGGDPYADYPKIGKLPPLGSGTLANGQTVHGFVAITMPTEGDVYIEISDPDQGLTYVEAGWKVHT